MNNKDINSSTEYIEEWDWEKAVPAGRPVERKLAHREGISHEGVHLWVVRLKDMPELLFQHRAPHKDLFPDCLDITVGGHVPFGITENKIQKESYEEIGISPADRDLIDLGYYRYEEKTGALFHREFQHVYLLCDNRSLDSYYFTDGEVDGIFAVKLSDFELLMKQDHVFKAEGYTGTELTIKTVSKKDFHPLFFTDPMKAYLDILIEAVKEVDRDKKVSVKMPSPV